MSWRVAESLLKLRDQINAAYPNRDKKSDGSIGDAKHATRSSDHNPWVRDGKMGVVTAIDIDEDLGDGGSLEHIITAIRKSRDKRVKYIIYEGRITVAGSDLQRWKKYTGSNAHKQHAHISVHSDRKLFDSSAEWDLGIEPKEEANVAAAQPAIPSPAPTPIQAIVPDPVAMVVEQVPHPRQIENQPDIEEIASPAPIPPSSDNVKVTTLIPHIDTAKAWLKRLFAGSALATIVATIAGLPLWLQIGLGVLVLTIVIGGVIIFVKNYDQVFALVGQAMKINADPSTPVTVQLVPDKRTTAKA